jgi:hypothetical protein
MKKRFLFYVDWQKQISLLNDEQLRRFIINLCNYAEEKPIDLPTDIEKAIWFGILPSLEINHEKYEKQAERSRENGKLGGRPKKPIGLLNNPENLVSDKWQLVSDKCKEINEKCEEETPLVQSSGSPVQIVSDGAIDEIEVTDEMKEKFKTSKAFNIFLEDKSTTLYKQFVFIYKIEENEEYKLHKDKFEEWMLNKFIEERKLNKKI